MAEYQAIIRINKKKPKTKNGHKITRLTEVSNSTERDRHTDQNETEGKSKNEKKIIIFLVVAEVEKKYI